jgi:hypothetical protein
MSGSAAWLAISKANMAKMLVKAATLPMLANADDRLDSNVVTSKTPCESLEFWRLLAGVDFEPVYGKIRMGFAVAIAVGRSS